jgi:hypothetical protein
MGKRREAMIALEEMAKRGIKVVIVQVPAEPFGWEFNVRAERLGESYLMEENEGMEIAPRAWAKGGILPYVISEVVTKMGLMGKVIERV